MNRPALKDDVDLLERMEKDLINKVADALNEYGVDSVVHGVFSIDDLENKTQKDLNGLLAVGVGYQGASRPGRGANNPTQGNAAAMGEYFFMIMFAAPSDAVCSQRYTATKVMTILRKAILGKPVDSDERTQRCWDFVQEKPETDVSEESMLYYTQLWRLAMPIIGN